MTSVTSVTSLAAVAAPPGTAHQPRTRRQWVTLALGVVVLASLCLVAGWWQWNRYVSREAEIARIEANYSAEPVPLGDVLPSPGDVLDPDDVWRPVTMVGHYETDATVLLRNRPIDGQGGFHVLVPFVTTTGTGPGDGSGSGSDGERVVVIVDRGFVPWGSDASTAPEIPVPPAGEVEVTVTLRADEPASGRSAPPAQVHAVSTAQVLAAGPSGDDWVPGTVGAYGQLRSEAPPSAQTLRALPRPDVDPGSHLSYTFQWCVFALGALGGFVLLVRRDRQERLGPAARTVTAGDLLAARGDVPDGAQGASIAYGAHRSRDGRAHRPTAEEEEDALIDAQLP